MALKVAVVGMGSIGNTHARCYKENPLAELVAVCDLVKEKADKAAERYGRIESCGSKKNGSAECKWTFPFSNVRTSRRSPC